MPQTALQCQLQMSVVYIYDYLPLWLLRTKLFTSSVLTECVFTLFALSLHPENYPFYYPISKDNIQQCYYHYIIDVVAPRPLLWITCFYCISKVLKKLHAMENSLKMGILSETSGLQYSVREWWAFFPYSNEPQFPLKTICSQLAV